MKRVFKTTLALSCCILFFLNLSAAEDAKSKRSVQKSFNVNSGSVLTVNNEYGVINIQEWDKNEVSLNVTITATAKNQADADKYANSVNVDLSQIGNQILAKTNYSDQGKCNCSRSVDYRIMAPKNIHYVLKNEFGNIEMGNAKGNVTITLEYGNLTALDLSGSVNTVKVEYGNINIGKLAGASNGIDAEYSESITVSSATNLVLSMEYSKFKISDVNQLAFHGEYSSAAISKAKSIQFDSEYTDVTIGETDQINGEAEFTNVKIDRLNKKLTIPSMEYGKLEIQNVSPQFETINVKSEFTPVDINLDKAVSCKVDLRTEFEKINVKVPLSKINDKISDNERVSQGEIGNASGSKGLIKIKNEYGHINIKQ